MTPYYQGFRVIRQYLVIHLLAMKTKLQVREIEKRNKLVCLFVVHIVYHHLCRIATAFWVARIAFWEMPDVFWVEGFRLASFSPTPAKFSQYLSSLF